MSNSSQHRALGVSTRERHLVVAPKLSLASSVYGFLLFFTFSFLAILTVSVSSRSDLVFGGALIEAASVRTDVAARDLSRFLDEEWAQLEFLAGLVERGASTEAVEEVMAGMSVDNSAQVWTALVSPVGAVVLATNPTIVGGDFSQASWLATGMLRGTVHVEPTSSGLSGPSVVIAHPILQDDRPIGTVVTVVPLSDIEVSVSNLATTLGVDLLLTDATERIVFSTISGVDSGTKVVLSGAANLDGSPAQKQVWPDGKVYYLSRAVEIVATDAPSMGWKLTGRLERTSFSVALNEVLRFALFVGGTLSLVLAVVAVIFVNVFIKPMSRLANAAVEIAQGGDDYPPEIRSSAESARLSAALAKLQSAQSRSKI